MLELQPISEFIDENENEIRPIIIKFQNSDLQEGEETQLRTGIYRKSDNITTVVATTKEILYTGDIKKDDTSNDDPNNRFLLIHNRETGQVRLVAVDIGILAPQLKHKENEVVDTSVNLNVSSVQKLNKEFGSKRIKRMTEQRERLQMNIDDVKKQLEETVAGVQIKETDSFTVQSNENESLYKPPINRDASTKEQIYVLNELVPKMVLQSLKDEANTILSSSLDQFDINPFIKPHLIELQNSSVPNKDEKCQLLLFLNYLLIYVNKPAKHITKKLVICKSEEVNSYILENFSVTSNTGRTRPLSMKDKTICYILVLSMIALNYEIDIEVLAKNIKVGVKKLQEMGRILAFTPHGKNKRMMVLKIPLPPAVSLSPKKRKR